MLLNLSQATECIIILTDCWLEDPHEVQSLGPSGTVHSVWLMFLIGCWLQDPHEVHSLQHTGTVHGLCVVFITNCWVVDSCGPHSLGPEDCALCVCNISVWFMGRGSTWGVHTELGSSGKSSAGAGGWPWVGWCGCLLLSYQICRNSWSRMVPLPQRSKDADVCSSIFNLILMENTLFTIIF